MLRRHAEADDLRRAEPQPVDVARDLGERQADAAAQDVGGAQALGRRLAAALGARLDGELVRLRHAALFQRLAQGVALTEAGSEAQPRLGAAFEALALVVQEWRAGHAGRALAIAALPCIAQLWLLLRLPALQQAFPELQVSIAAMEEPPSGPRAAFDLALFYLSQLPAGALVLAQDSLVPVCAPALAEGLARPADLAGRTLLHDAVWRGDWARWLRHARVAGVDPSRGPSYSLYALALDAALGGAGVLIGRQTLVAGLLARGRLVAPFDLPMPSGDRLTLLPSPTRPQAASATGAGDGVAWRQRLKSAVIASVSEAIQERQGFTPPWIASSLRSSQ